MRHLLTAGNRIGADPATDLAACYEPAVGAGSHHLTRLRCPVGRGRHCRSTLWPRAVPASSQSSTPCRGTVLGNDSRHQRTALPSPVSRADVSNATEQRPRESISSKGMVPAGRGRSADLSRDGSDGRDGEFTRVTGEAATGGGGREEVRERRATGDGRTEAPRLFFLSGRSTGSTGGVFVCRGLI